MSLTVPITEQYNAISRLSVSRPGMFIRLHVQYLTAAVHESFLCKIAFVQKFLSEVLFRMHIENSAI